ncbi:DUF3466 family protein [Aeromonas bivalvium]|uniref:DUF3466 family protein n=1 Tax=Aeromonas bivalvium TaxID=440079 RepID=UPI0038D0BFD9
MKKQLSILAVLVGASLNAQAAQSPFFTITEVGQGYGVGISADNSVLALKLKNDAGSFFSSAPFSDFLVDRFRFDQNCILSGDVCDAFWKDNANFGYQWRRDFLDASSQRDNLGLSGNETDGLVVAMGPDNGTYVGYKASKNAVNGLANSRTGFAVINNGNQVALDGSYLVNGTNVLSSATSVAQISGSQYLVTGTAATGKNRKVTTDEYKECYSGDDDSFGDYRYCPGVDTQAAFWLVDNGAATLFQPSNYYDDDTNMVQTASALQAAKLKDGSWVAVGYSATDEEYAEHSLDLAAYWTLDPAGKTVGATKAIPLSDGKPDDSDASLRGSWASGVNANGYVIGNQRYGTNKGQNRPVEMFVFNLNSPTSNAAVPLKNSPINGANSEAAAINDHNMVVGWRDSRHQTQPVSGGTNRMQEAFLLNAANGSNWYLNDLICGLNDAGSKSCSQNGAYYHIAYASGISADGTIAATAYRYASETDLNNRSNATVVSVKLSPDSLNYEGIASDRVVANAPVVNQTGQDGDGGGGGGGSLFWLTLLGLPFAWLRRRG